LDIITLNRELPEDPPALTSFYEEKEDCQNPLNCLVSQFNGDLADRECSEETIRVTSS